MRIDKPLTQEQLKQGDLIKPGVYQFVVLQAEDTHSKAGNDMMKLQLRIYTDDGRERLLYDYLLEALEYKLGHFAEVTGLLDKYNAGELAAHDCVGKSGLCKIGIKHDKSGQYADQNQVVDYISDTKGSLTAPLSRQEGHPELSDEIPF